MKRILIFSIAYEPLVGGAELAVRSITDRLSSYEFDLITARFSGSHQAREKTGNVMVYRVGFGNRFGRYLFPFFAVRLAARLHRQNPYRIVWGIMAAYAGLAALRFKQKFPELKFLLTLQEGDPIEHIHRRVRFFAPYWRQIFKKADYIQAISRYLAEWAKQEGAVGPIEVVPNGVTPSLFSPLSRGRLRGGEVLKIITTSRLVPKNGIDILIKAVAVIATPHLLRGKQSQETAALRHGVGARSDIKLVIVGDGPEEGRLRRLAKDLDIEDVVEFIGKVPADKVPNYLAQADIFVRSSRSEGLGNSFLEAMAAGLPVIGTPVGGIPEFLVPYNSVILSEAKDPKDSIAPTNASELQNDMEQANGLFVKTEDSQDLAEKLNFLIEYPDIRRKLGQNGRLLVESKYDWQTIAQQMDKIFVKLSTVS